MNVAILTRYKRPKSVQNQRGQTLSLVPLYWLIAAIVLYVLIQIGGAL